MRLRACPASAAKSPPTRIIPSGCTAKARTRSAAPGLKPLSRVARFTVNRATMLITEPNSLLTTTS